MKILVDAMGGDHAPLEILCGAVEAARDGGITPILVGNRSKIGRCAEENGIDLSRVTVVHAENEIAMDEPPLSVRTKPDTSLKKAMQMLAAGEGDALVSAGSTGAVQTAATLFVKRVQGVRRSAIGTVLPTDSPVLLIDSGANTTYSPKILHDYAVMGAVYASCVTGIDRPRIGLLNIGAEESKGRADYPEAYRLLKSDGTLNFIGNVEASAVPFGVCDVLVCDGFTGNVFLKTIEGVSRSLLSRLQGEDARRMKMRFDPAESGGAMLFGISAPVIKAHGASDRRAIANAIRQAARCAAEGVCAVMAERIAERNAEDACAAVTEHTDERSAGTSARRQEENYEPESE